MNKWILFFLGLGFFCGCSSDTLPEYNRLDNLRVMALSLDKPEVSFDATQFPITLVPVISDFGSTSAPSYLAEACWDPGVSFGAEPTCESSTTRFVLGSGSVSTLASPRKMIGRADAVQITWVQVQAFQSLFNALSATQRANGYSLLITYRLTALDGRSVKSFKRLVFSERSPKNQNPGLAQILVNGASFSGTSSPQSVNLSPQFSQSPENYSETLENGEIKTRTEEYITTWFITPGIDSSAYRSLGLESVGVSFPSVPSSGGLSDFYVVAVSRDNRGGVSGQVRCFGACNGFVSESF